MRFISVKPATRLRGEITPLGDKSIAHRSIIVSALSKAKTRIKNFPVNNDTLSTLKAFQDLGIRIIKKPGMLKGSSVITVFGKGLYGLNKPRGSIFTGDSGTTLRIILGVLAGQGFEVKLIAGRSLSKRPMSRVTVPLRLMGAKIVARRLSPAARQEEYPPILIKGGDLKAITYRMPVASAQVKSAILLAGLYAKGSTQVIEDTKTRDHTERILKLFKANIKVIQNKIVIKGNKKLISPKKIYIPGDLSSASFFMVLAAILKDSRVLIRNVSLNPSRTGIIRVLNRMGADIKVSSLASRVAGYEPMGNLVIKSSKLKGTMVKREEIPSLIDELPILMVAACFARGKTVFEGVRELRVKETDRVSSMSWNLSKMGASIKIIKRVNSEDIAVQGAGGLMASRVKSFGDHRTAMSMVVAGLAAKGETLIDDVTCINKSFPGFLSILKGLIN